MADTPEKLGKVGIVLTGGFLRGAFQAGALQAFHEHGIRPAYIVGASVGALNGAAFAVGKMDTLLSMYTALAPRPSKFLYDWNLHGLLRLFFWSESVLLATPLRRLIEKRLGIAELIASDVKMDIITTDFQSGAAKVFSNKVRAHQDPELLTNALLASAAMPVVFPPFLYEGHQLFDGGIIAANPISHAIREGCDTVFAILTDSQQHMRTSKLFHSVYFIARRAGNLMSWRVGKKDIERGMEINANLDAYEKLLHEVTQAVAENTASGQAVLVKEVRKAFSKQRFSFQGKRQVRLVVIEPDASEENESYALFRLVHKTVSGLLAEGHRKTVAAFRELGIASRN